MSRDQELRQEAGRPAPRAESAVVRNRLGPFDLVMLDVGADHPSWGHVQLGPQNALDLLGGGALLPVHWGTFSRAMYAGDQPADRLLDLGTRCGLHRVIPRLGQPVSAVSRA